MNEETIIKFFTEILDKALKAIYYKFVQLINYSHLEVML